MGTVDGERILFVDKPCVRAAVKAPDLPHQPQITDKGKPECEQAMNCGVSGEEQPRMTRIARM
jgi:hypothetical protein